MIRPFVFDEIVALSSPQWTERCRKLSMSPQDRRGIVIQQPTRIGVQDILGATEICAFCPFEAVGPLPAVTQLSLLGPASVTESTAQAFSGLKAFRAEGSVPVDVSWFKTERLRSLALKERTARNAQALREMPVRQFRIEWRELPGECFPREVTHLVVNTWKPMSSGEVAAISKMPRLESLMISGATVLENLRAFAGVRAIGELSVSARSIDGATHLAGLKSLRLTGKIPDLSGLSSLTQVETLELYVQGSRAEAALATLPELSSLKRLVVDCVGIDDFEELGSLAFLDRVASLEELVLNGVVLRDPDVTPIHRLKALRTLEMFGTFGKDVEELRVTTRADLVTVKNVGSLTEAGRVLAPKRMGTGWALFDDLSSRLNQSNNYDVEQKVREELASEVPEMAARLSFDSEAGMFSVSSPRREDIEHVVVLIDRLVGRIGRS